MKKFVSIAFCFLLFSFLHSLGTLHVKSIKELPATHTNLTVYDADGKFAPVLIVKTEIKNLGFNNISRPTKHAALYDEMKHEYKFYMNDNQRVIEITHTDYEPLEIRLLAEFGINVKAQRVYELELDYKQDVVQVPVIISSNKSNAAIYVDGKEIGRTENGKLTANIGSGTRSIRIEKEDFASQEIEENISMENNSFSFDLLPSMPSTVKITSNPSGAVVYIDNLLFGTTPVENFYDTGTYPIRIEKQNYETIEEMITVLDPGTTKEYELWDIRANLTINTNPNAVVIFEHEEYPGGFTNKILLPQTISFRIEQEFCETIEQVYALKKGETKIIELYPKDISASLTINTNPDAVVIFNGERYSGGFKEFKLLPGQINFRIEQEFCETIDRTYTLKEGDEKVFNLYPKDNSARLTIKTDPKAVVRFNDEQFQGGITNYILTPQVLKVSVELNKADPITKIITLKENTEETYEIYPEIKTGSIMVRTIPADASVEIIGDADENFHSVGGKDFVGIPIGNYKLRVTKKDYLDFEEEFYLDQGDTITKTIKLDKANYKIHFVNNTTELLESLDMKITKNGEDIYTGKGKQDVSFSESGEYKIEITKDKKFGFTKKIKIGKDKLHFVSLKNQILIAKNKRIEKARKQIDLLYDIDSESNEVCDYQSLLSILSPAPGFNAPFYYLFSENAHIINLPLFAKYHFYDLKPDDIYEGRNYSFFYGFTMLGNSYIASNMIAVDSFSGNAGFIIFTNDHKFRLRTEIDALGKFLFPYDLTKDKHPVTFVKDIEIVDNELKVKKTNYWNWFPLDASITLERNIGQFSIMLRVGILWFTELGLHPEAKWYYKELLENWQTGEPVPEPITGDPDLFSFDSLVPYWGIGIGF